MKAEYSTQTNKTMKWLAMSFFAVLLSVFLAVTGLGQTVPPKVPDAGENWMRIVSDDGEFSIDFPEKYNYFFNKNGFEVYEPGAGSSYDLKQVRHIKGYLNGTLVSIQCYKASKKALNALYKSQNERKKDLTESEIKKPDYSIRQTVRKSEDLYLVRQYLYSKTSVYVITAGSRSGDTAVMKHFFDSLIFYPKKAMEPLPSPSIKFSSLQATEPAFERKLDLSSPPASLSKNQDLPKDSDEKGPLIFYKPRPGYTDSARQANVAGTIVFKITFATDAHISRIELLRELPEGLIQQALFALMRVEFLPAEKRGIPKAVTRKMEYTFSIY